MPDDFDFLNAAAPRRFNPPQSRHSGPGVAIATTIGVAVAVSIVVGLALLWHVSGKPPEPALQPPAKEQWPSGPKSYSEALATYNGELDVLGRLRVTRLAIERGDHLDTAERLILEVYQRELDAAYRGGNEFQVRDARLQVESTSGWKQIQTELADIDATIKTQNEKVERARQRRDALDR
jgi:hypothetical protein